MGNDLSESRVAGIEENLPLEWSRGERGRESPPLDSFNYTCNITTVELLHSGSRPLMSDAHLLTDLQIAIMRVLWERGSASAAEICETLRPERGLAQSTVATLLTRLEIDGDIATLPGGPIQRVRR